MDGSEKNSRRSYKRWTDDKIAAIKADADAGMRFVQVARKHAIAETSLQHIAKTRGIAFVRKKAGAAKPKRSKHQASIDHANDLLRQEIAAARAEIESGTAPPFKGGF